MMMFAIPIALKLRGRDFAPTSDGARSSAFAGPLLPMPGVGFKTSDAAIGIGSVNVIAPGPRVCPYIS